MNFSTVVGTTGIKSLPVGILDGFFLLVVFTASAVKYGTTIKLLEVFSGLRSRLNRHCLVCWLDCNRCV